MHKFTLILGVAIACCTMPGVSSATQQLTLDEAEVRLRDLKAQIARKGEFETTQEFEARRAMIQQQIGALLRGAYPDTSNVGFGTYDADTQILPVSGKLKLVVSPSDARWIKEQSSPIRGSGTYWLEENGGTFLIGRLTIKVGTRTFLTEPSSIRIQILKTEPFPRLPNNPAGRGPLAFSPAGGYIATNNAYGNWVLSGKTGERLHKYSPCFTATFSVDDRYFACAWTGGFNRDASIHVDVLDLETGDWSNWTDSTADDQPAIDFSPLTNVLAIEVLRDSGPAVLLWDVDRAEAVKTIPLSGVGAVTDLEFGPRGEVLAIARAPYRRRRMGPTRLWMLDLQTGNVASTSREGGITQFLPDGGRYLADSSIHSTRTGEVVARLEKGGGHLYVSPDGSIIAGSPGRDGLLWDAATGVIVRELKNTHFFGFFANGDLLLYRSGRVRIMKRGNWE